MSQATTTTGGAGSPPASDVRQTPAGESEQERTPTARDDDELFEILANQRRRFALHYLRQYPEEPVSLSTLSEHVAGWEHGVDPETLEYGERKSVRNSLHQFHLPKLDDAGIVAYDEGDSEVALLDTAGADAYRAVVEEDADTRWSGYAFAAAAGALAVYALSALGVLAALPSAAWTVLFVGAFVLAAVPFLADRYGDREAGPPPECDADG